MRKSKDALALKLNRVMPHLNERQKRILAASEALALGRGGIQRVSQVTGLSRPTVYRGIDDIEKSKRRKVDNSRIREPGGGRKSLKLLHPKLSIALDELIEPTMRGDPESRLRWTCKSIRHLERELKALGFQVHYCSVAKLLHEQDYSLQANRKTTEGKKDHPDRDAQFRHINNEVKQFIKDNQPVISVDTKKKELVGNYKNPGREWTRKGTAAEVLSHDFPDPKVPKAVPYGVYDIGKNTGWVNVGVDADTAEFATASIRHWWTRMGKKRYPRAKQILICADSGGSNGYRSHLWKRELQKFCCQFGLRATVCHFPPGTSKWNKIEHRLFSFISMNWRGKPLIDYQTIVNLIAATKTRAGLTVKVRLDTRHYEKGIKVSKEELAKIKITRCRFHGEWNYTIWPTKIY